MPRCSSEESHHARFIVEMGVGTWKGVEAEKGEDRERQEERKRAREAGQVHMGTERVEKGEEGLR